MSLSDIRRSDGEPETIKYLTEWAEHKIIQMAQTNRPMNFINVADLARGTAFF